MKTTKEWYDLDRFPKKGEKPVKTYRRGWYVQNYWTDEQVRPRVRKTCDRCGLWRPPFTKYHAELEGLPDSTIDMCTICHQQELYFSGHWPKGHGKPHYTKKGVYYEFKGE